MPSSFNIVMETTVGESFDDCQTEPIRLYYRTANSLRHAFGTLLAASIFDNSSKIVKTKLQVLCASISRSVLAPYAVELLQQHKNGEDSLSYADFITYVETDILPKGTKIVDEQLLESIDKIAWTISMSKDNDEKHQLMQDDLFRLWQVFNTIDICGDLAIDKDEVANVYEEFMKATGTPWMPAKLEEYCSARRLMTFQDVIECLEKHYLTNLPKSLHKEGIKALSAHYVNQQIKSGSLVKKGHRIKSMKERWFVLKPTQLMYFTNKQEREKKGSITINNSAKVDCGQETKGMKSRFLVTCGATGTQYEIEAPNQRTRNEWVAAISLCIDCEANEGPLFVSLSERKQKREEQFKQLQLEKEEKQRQESIIQSQLEELENLRIARQKAEAHAEEESVLLDEERKRREALEMLKSEYELLLEEERKAREEELKMRELQQTILDEEKQKRERLEEIKRQQEELLELERRRREGLEEESKEKEKLLDEERQKMKELDAARISAETAVQQAHAKLEAAEEERRKAADAVEAAKKKARDIKVPIGLARPIQGGAKGITTHRGQGAFSEADFILHVRMEGDEEPKSSNEIKAAGIDSIEHTPLVKPSQARQRFEGAASKDTKSVSRIGTTEAKLIKTFSCDDDANDTTINKPEKDISTNMEDNKGSKTDDSTTELTKECSDISKDVSRNAENCTNTDATNEDDDIASCIPLIPTDEKSVNATAVCDVVPNVNENENVIDVNNTATDTAK